MKVFFNHLAKCGGSTINYLAKTEFEHNFHVLTYSTSPEQLQSWLDKERVFISSEMLHAKEENIYKILKDTNIKRILLSRDPLERFLSFHSHAKRNSNSPNSTNNNFWGLEEIIHYPLETQDWLNLGLQKLERLMITENSYIELDLGLYFSIYSQWFLGSFQGFYKEKEKTFSYSGTNTLKEHILNTRKSVITSGKQLNQYIYDFVNMFYSTVGVTDDLNEFVRTLIHNGIFSENILAKKIPKINTSKKARSKNYSFDKYRAVIVKYISILPEEFCFYNVCKYIGRFQYEKIKSLYN